MNWKIGFAAAVIVFAGLVGCFLVFSAVLPAPAPVVHDTARLYFPPGTTEHTDLYAAIGQYGLHQWHTIRVFGEAFHACALAYEGNETLFTVNPDDARRCGPLPD